MPVLWRSECIGDGLLNGHEIACDVCFAYATTRVSETKNGSYNTFVRLE